MSACVGGPSIFVRDEVLNLAASDSADTSGITGMNVSIIDTCTCWMVGAAAGAGAAAAPATGAPAARVMARPVLGSTDMFAFCCSQFDFAYFSSGFIPVVELFN